MLPLTTAAQDANVAEVVQATHHQIEVVVVERVTGCGSRERSHYSKA